MGRVKGKAPGGVTIATVGLSHLIPAPNNPNQMPEQEYRALVANMRVEGFLQPILVVPSGSSGKYAIVDGHHRYKVALEIGLTEAPCVIARDKSPEQVQALRIAMNRIRGVLDLSGVAKVLTELEESGWTMDDMARTGYSAGEIQSLISSLEVPDTEALMAPAPVSKREPEPERDATASKPWSLELRFKHREDYKLALRALKKAAGKSKDPARGLLALLGTTKKKETSA